MSRVKAVLIFGLLCSIVVMAGAVPAKAHDFYEGSDTNPFVIDSMSEVFTWNHIDYDPTDPDSDPNSDTWKGYFSLTVQNNSNVNWGDFHFRINDPDVLIVSATGSLPGGPITGETFNDANGARADFEFYATPLLIGEVANFSIYTDNTITGGLFTISAYPTPVPVPAAAWLLGSGLLGLAGIRRKRAA